VKLEEYKLLFSAVGLIGVLLIATPALVEVIHLPGGEQFSELYLLNSNGMAENYPYNIVVGQNYSVIVGVGNDLGSSAYYVLYVKFGNQTDQLPDSTSATSSPLAPLYEYRFFVQDGGTWESPLTFSVTDAYVLGNQSMVKTLTVNGLAFGVDKPAAWDVNSTAFSYQIFLELWIYDAQNNSIQFNNRFVSLQLNLTQIAIPSAS
jgi:hypothetical protein